MPPFRRFLDKRPVSGRLKLFAAFLLCGPGMLWAAEPPLVAAAPLAGPTPPAGSAPLAAVIDRYVAEAFAGNLGLRAATLDVGQSQAALDAARGRLLPEAALEARYTRAEGGRAIEIPLAQALNPVYGSLNDLLAASGRPGTFPQIEDSAFPLLREREQDTRITLRQPLFAPALPAAVRAQRAALDAHDFARLALARRLKRDVTVGYLGWLQGARALGIVDSSRALLQENLRVNESLLRNGKVTGDQVLRARAELLAVEQQQREAQNARDQARSALNFLLNRPLDTALDAAEPDGALLRARHDLAALRKAALENRPELAQLDRAVDGARQQIRLAQAARWPTLSLGVDGGTQGEAYEFGRGSNFATVSLLLNWTITDGGTRRSQVRASRLAEQQRRVQRDELASRIQLEVQQALDQLGTTADSLSTAEARAEAARAGFRIASRKRDEGVINQVEFIDSRNALSAAELNLNVTRFALLARQAELDYATAAGSLPALPGGPAR
jgi:outer membrane protein